MKGKKANSLSGSEWLKNSFSIWKQFKKDADAAEHPATFPIELVSRIIDCYASNRSGVLLDPFAGSGSSLLAALKIGMDAIGFDINPNYKELFLERLKKIEPFDATWKFELKDSCKHIKKIKDQEIEICVTSPPYWDILNRKRTVDRKETVSYSNKKYDIGNIEEYDSYLKSIENVAHQVAQVLRPHAYFVINVMDIRKKSNFYPLHQDVANSILKTGCFSFEDIIIWDRQSEYNFMRPLGYPYKFIINRVHEYLLVFRENSN